MEGITFEEFNERLKNDLEFRKLAMARSVRVVDWPGQCNTTLQNRTSDNKKSEQKD